MDKKLKVALVGVEWDIVDLIDSLCQLEMVGFFDPSPQNLGEYLHLGGDDAWSQYKPFLKVVLALDDPKLRARLFSHYGADSLLTLISPYAHVSPRTNRDKFGIGSIIQRGVSIMPHAILGQACKVNVNATIHHEAQIGNFCTLAPGAQILGRVVLEDRVYVGAGAIIRQRCRIGTGAVIGAGAVVVTDIPPHVTVVGVPAKEMVRASKS